MWIVSFPGLGKQREPFSGSHFGSPLDSKDMREMSLPKREAVISSLQFHEQKKVWVEGQLTNFGLASPDQSFPYLVIKWEKGKLYEYGQHD